MSTPKKSDDAEVGSEKRNQLFPTTLFLTPAPLAPCGRGAGGEGSESSHRESQATEQAHGLFLGPPQKSPPAPMAGTKSPPAASNREQPRIFRRRPKNAHTGLLDL